MLDSVLKDFGLQFNDVRIIPLTQGLINGTWKIVAKNESYVMQKINDNVFKNPFDIATNIDNVAAYLNQHYPEYLFPSPLKNDKGFSLVHESEYGYYRIFPFIPDSHSKDVVETSSQAYEAAAQFGRFTKLLAAFDANKLKITLPDFHNLSLRYQQFKTAVEKGNPKRIAKSTQLIEDLFAFSYIVDVYEKIKVNPAFKLRVTHHDTKISNVLFNNQNQGLCVIDLDTLMPGYFISDLGDMMRTYLCPVSEESTDWDQIEIRTDVYEAIVAGYIEEMKDELSEEEKAHVYYSGCFMIYMQALRFLTDYLNDDVYYGKKYEEHNYNRALNQYLLLKSLERNKEKLQQLQFAM